MIEEIKSSNQNIKLSLEDLEWMLSEYPSLKTTNKKISGEICIQRTYNEITILDCFNIEVNLKHNDKSMLPTIKCTDKKIINIADKLSKKIDDLHINNDSTFCLTIYPDEVKYFTNSKFNIKDYFKNLVEPFLYWISFYSKYKQAPWDEYAHGFLGIIEYIGDNNLDFRKMYTLLKKENISLRKILSMYRQRQCLCDEIKLKNKSQSKMRNCHPRIWNGIKRIKYLVHKKICKISQG